MERYKNLGGNSGVAEYETKEDAITVKFKDGAQYLYNYASAGKDNIEEMKRLAIIGKGLNSYISRYVKN